jgi:transposase-like protein
MTFIPPCCPNRLCAAHLCKRFGYQRRGQYRRKSDGRLVQRYVCCHCDKYFSSQTFRLDYRLKRPQLNAPALRLLCSKVTLRQAARILGCNRKTAEHRLRLLGSHGQQFQLARLSRLRGKLRGRFLLDELETFESDRRLQPLTVPVLIERDSLFVLDQRVATLPARGSLRPAKAERKAELEAARGVRTNGSSAAVKACCEQLAQYLEPGYSFLFDSDKKTVYASHLERLFGARVTHLQQDSKARRDNRNPLFAINLTLAMMRDGLSRLVRRTWAHTKRASRLGLHLWLWSAYRNFVRYRTNKKADRKITPAVALGLEKAPWTVSEMLRLRAYYLI